LVVHGFFNDLIRKVGVPAIEEKLYAIVETELAKNVNPPHEVARLPRSAPPAHDSAGTPGSRGDAS
jgi:hypothetical protein